MRRRCRHSGFVVIELVTSLALLGMILVATGAFLISYRRMAGTIVAHRQAQLAAERYVEWRRGTGEAPPPIEGIEYEVKTNPGQDFWTGLVRLQVTSHVAVAGGLTASYTLVTYVLEDIR